MIPKNKSRLATLYSKIESHADSMNETKNTMSMIYK